jgi:hypothetical protein
VRGHLRPRSGGWELSVYVGRDPLSGRKRYRSKTVSVAGRRQAENALAAFVAEADSHHLPGPARRSVGELLDQWYEACSLDWSPNSARFVLELTRLPDEADRLQVAATAP